MTMKLVTLVGWTCLAMLGCQEKAPPPSPEPSATMTAIGAGSAAPSASAPQAAASIDPAAVEAATGLKPEAADGVVKVSYPRNDVKVEVDGWAMPPFMGLTSWAGFTRGEKPGVEAMVMGDLVLFEDEVNDAMSAALSNGIAVTALHNHFFFDRPHVYF